MWKKLKNSIFVISVICQIMQQLLWFMTSFSHRGFKKCLNPVLKCCDWQHQSLCMTFHLCNFAIYLYGSLIYFFTHVEIDEIYPTLGPICSKFRRPQSVLLFPSYINRGQCSHRSRVISQWAKTLSTKAGKYCIMKSSWEQSSSRWKISGNSITFIVRVRVPTSDSCVAFRLSNSY